MRILLVGGTGAMGLYLRDILRRTGHEVFVTSRKKNDDPYFFCGDAHESDFRKRVLVNKYDAVIDFLIYSVKEFREIAPEYLESTSQYVFLSSARVYANSLTPSTEEAVRLIDECRDLKYLQSEEYAVTKALQENFLKNSHYGNYTIVRPYITYGDERLQLGLYEKESWLYRAIKGKTVIISKDILSKETTMTYGYDVAGVISQLIGKKETLGEIFNITSPYHLTWARVLEIYSKAFQQITGEKMKIKVIESSDKISKVMKRHYQFVYDRSLNRVFDSRKVEEIVEWDYLKPEEGLERCLRNCLKKKETVHIANPVQEAYLDLLAGETTKLTEFKSAKDQLKYIIAKFTPYGLLRIIR